MTYYLQADVAFLVYSVIFLVSRRRPLPVRHLIRERAQMTLAAGIDEYPVQQLAMAS